MSMVSFEKFKPILIPGKAIPQGDKLVYEIDNPVDQIVLPIEAIDFLLLCQGEYTIADIVERIYHSKGAVHFKLIYKTIYHLKDRGFLLNGEDLKDSSQTRHHNESQFINLKSLFELNLGYRIWGRQERPVFFYAIAMLTILMAVLTLQTFHPSWLSFDFIKINGSYLKGLGFTIVWASLLLSAKHLFKCFMLLLLTGRVYNFGFVFSGLAFYFRVKSDSLFLVSHRLYLALFHSALALFYFPFIGFMTLLVPDMPYYNQAMNVATILFILSLNPFQESELSQLLRAILKSDNINKLSHYLNYRPLISLVHPLEGGQNPQAYWVYSQIALVWCCTVIYTATHHLLSQTSNVILHTKEAGFTELSSALLTYAVIIAFLGVVVVNTYKLMKTSFVNPIWALFLDRLRRQRSQRLDYYNHNELIKRLEGLPLFSYLSQELLEMVANRSELKMYKKGSPVIIQGDTGTHLFVLLSGHLSVRKRLASGAVQLIGEVRPPSIFGEVAVLEEKPRSAEVLALENSIVLEVPAKMLRQIAQDSQHIRELHHFNNAIAVNQFFTSAPIFKDLPENVVHLFTVKGKIEDLKPNQIIFRQGDQGDGFYLLLRGSVGVSVNGRPVSRIHQGGFFW
jgi:CRP-like cAMP-binding protein